LYTYINDYLTQTAPPYKDVPKSAAVLLYRHDTMIVFFSAFSLISEKKQVIYWLYGRNNFAGNE